MPRFCIGRIGTIGRCTPPRSLFEFGAFGPRVTLWRAAHDDYLPSDVSFARRREDAEEYRNNPHFGGPRLFRARITPDPSKVLDVSNLPRRAQTSSICTALGEDEDCGDSRGLHEPHALFDMDPDYADRAADAGYEWVVYTDDFPEGCETWRRVAGEDPDLEEVT